MWKYRFQGMTLTPTMYTYNRFQSPNLWYTSNHCSSDGKMRFPTFGLLQGHCYVGSTSIGAARRDFNRAAKIKQLQQRQVVHVELSLRYWAERPNYTSLSTIVLQVFDHYNDAWIHEHCLISRWQPALNHPFIFKHFRLKTSGWKMQFRQSQHVPLKLGPLFFYQWIRRRLRTFFVPTTMYSTQAKAWKALYDLSRNTAASYQAAQLVRSVAFHDWEVCGLYRLSQYMEEPGAITSPQSIEQSFSFRNCTLPKKNIPLAIPFLVHPTFGEQLSTWCRQIIILHKDEAIPRHIPTHRLRQKAFPKLKDRGIA